MIKVSLTVPAAVRSRVMRGIYAEELERLNAAEELERLNAYARQRAASDTGS